MTAIKDIKQERINLRLKPEAKALLERAASFEGKTVSSYILTSAMANAEKTVHEHEAMRLNAKDSEAFLEALSKPVQLNKKLLDAFEEHDQRVTSR
ncbi:DUF1778 domain-containing protein [Natronospirillum operosum]|uniref:DUF1778 domain-containing protein n=1 Tax=Natronospirillum operosum TaxID=2759953 RepID=A0A4Z0WFC0_9GAMM|nr:DUF1778 domain-containing protein [Natronospirillum operosum]TGG93851.1 DUF1778 domain-containing protein [Natronospirillum operosum]